MAGARRAKKAHVGGELKFEEAIARLEAIVKELEGAEVPLEKALGLFEEGVRLSKLCNATLEEAEKKVRVLLKNEAGELEEGPFEAEADEDEDAGEDDDEDDEEDDGKSSLF